MESSTSASTIVINENSKALANFVNAIRSPATKTVYLNSLRRYMRHGYKMVTFVYAVIDEIGEKRLFPTCKKISRDIDNHLKDGQNVLKVKRDGMGLETNYHIGSV